MSKESYHVVHSSDGCWGVRKPESVRALKLFRTQDEAIDWAHKIASKQAGEMVIHKKDGTIRSKETFIMNSEPTPPKSREDRESPYLVKSSKKKNSRH